MTCPSGLLPGGLLHGVTHSSTVSFVSHTSKLLRRGLSHLIPQGRDLLVHLHLWNSAVMLIHIKGKGHIHPFLLVGFTLQYA